MHEPHHPHPEEPRHHLEPEEHNPAQEPEVIAQPKADFWRFTAELVRTALIVAVLAYAIRILILQPFVVEGSSMFPRFHTNDFLIVDKVSYRMTDPQRGDIVVFKYPADPDTNYVKRIIGLPGDTVRIADGKVQIINSSHPQGITLDEKYLLDGTSTTLTGQASRTEFTVPEDNFFVMGDNRRASSDSRQWGFLPRSNVIGRVVVQMLPLQRASWVSHARYDSL